MSHNFTTQANNFTSALETKVDPRVGQFILNLGLASLNGNRKLGPLLNLFLNYSPLNSPLNYGFGKHISLGGLSSFNTTSNILALSSGERYKVIPGTTSLINKKLDTFRFLYSNQKDKEEGYTILWKDGKKEVLEVVGDGDTYVVKKISSPLGREMNLTWSWSGETPRLSEIRDEKELLCQIEYSFITKVTLWPGSKEEYSLHFKTINYDQLDTIYLSVGEKRKLYWFFSYDAINFYSNLLTQVTYPSGVKESVLYNQETGLSFPELSLQEKLPIVIKHELELGGEEPKTITEYEYTSNNFLGYEGDFGDWESDSDYIYNMLTDYTYGSTAKVISEGAVIETIRLYNNYHLQISEEIKVGDTSQLSEIQYYAKPFTLIEAQPNQFQLPKEKKETWINRTEKTQRTQKTEFQYDEKGNPIREVSPKGVVTEISWYDPEGEQGCPKEPNGFTRFMREKKVIYPPSENPSPSLSTRYLYKNLGESSFIVQESEEKYSEEALISKKTYHYHTEKGEEFARLLYVESTLVDLLEPNKSYTSKTYFENTFNEEEFSQKISAKGFDGLEVSFSHTFSRHSHLLLHEISHDGKRTNYTYDDLGRILSLTTSVGTKYESTKTWQYEYVNKILRVTESDSQGNSIRTSYNGIGIEILKEVKKEDSSISKWYPISKKKYNSLKETTFTESSDWILPSKEGGSESKITLKEKYEYDNWGNLEALLSQNNVKHIHKNDPISLTSYKKKEAPHLKTAVTLTHWDEEGKPLSLIIKDSKGEEISQKSIKYNAAGDVIEEIDELGNSTKYEYYKDGRLKTQILPDGTEIYRTYAPFLSQDCLTSLSVKGKNSQGIIQTWVLGTQEFDSLARITKSTSGGRTTCYQYEGVSSSPSSKTTPSGDKIEYSYIKELNELVSEVKSGSIIQSFEYDPLTSFPLKAKENNGSEVENIWNKAGNLESVVSSLEGQGERKSSYTSTLLKGVLSYTDFSGKTSHYVRNDLGLITQIKDDEISFTQEYDELSRVISQKTINLDTQKEITLNFKYNEMDQEIYRCVLEGEDEKGVITQEWTKTGQISQKKTSQKDQTLIETYEYDSRHRLISYSATGSPLPKNSEGKTFLKQSYQYDCLGNITSLATELEDKSIDETIYHFDNPQDPTQTTRLSYISRREVLLKYDENGRLIQDEEGKSLSYDALGRLVEVLQPGENPKQGSYYYDALDKIVQKKITQGNSYSLYYNDEEMVNQFISSGDSPSEVLRIIKKGKEALGVSFKDQLTLTASTSSHSLLYAHQEGEEEGNLYNFTPYGEGETPELLPAFNGEFKDSLSSSYLLGNGYRPYSPSLMRFTAPDSLSPFSEGGINPYSYCLGDPVNRVDSSGHLSTEAWVGVGMSVASLSLSVLTGGASILAAGGVSAALSSAGSLALVVGISNVVSDASAIASQMSEDSSPETSQALGWLSLATGALGLLSSLKTAPKILSKLCANLKAKSEFTSYGYDLKGLISPRFTPTGGEYFVFTDKTHGKIGTRLTIVGHGQNQFDGTYKMRVTTNLGETRRVDPEFFAFLKDKDYTRVRLIMCNSGTGGENSFAAKLARIIEKPVKGYEGNLTASSHYKEVYDMIRSEAPPYVSRDEILDIMKRDFERRGKYPICKTFYEEKWLWCFKKRVYTNYKPRRFNASGELVSKEDWIN